MTNTDIIIIAIIAVVISFSVWKIIKDKKKGVKCPGCGTCPAAKSCHIPNKNSLTD
jgi:hypothetical protein